jgi:hypothetical protein
LTNIPAVETRARIQGWSDASINNPDRAHEKKDRMHTFPFARVLGEGTPLGAVVRGGQNIPAVETRACCMDTFVQDLVAYLSEKLVANLITD